MENKKLPGRPKKKRHDALEKNEIDGGYMTVSGYAKKHNVKTQTVYSKIKLGTIQVLKIDNITFVK